IHHLFAGHEEVTIRAADVVREGQRALGDADRHPGTGPQPLGPSHWAQLQGPALHGRPLGRCSGSDAQELLPALRRMRRCAIRRSALMRMKPAESFWSKPPSTSMLDSFSL